jgi:hypothetical protein
VLINPDSDNSSLFNSEEKNELIYHLFKILCVGGAMSQPDSTISRQRSLISFPLPLLRNTLTHSSSVASDILSSRSSSTKNSLSSTSTLLLHSSSSHHLIGLRVMVKLNQLARPSRSLPSLVSLSSLPTQTPLTPISSW